MKLYVASSWRNPYQQAVVAGLRDLGHEVYDFRHPPGGDHLGFSWDDTLDDPNRIPWREWDVDRYLTALRHPVALAGFASDFGAMRDADAGVLVLPCGRSAHIEAGWMLGVGKPVWVVLDPAEFVPGRGDSNPELMYLIAGHARILRDTTQLFTAVGLAPPADPPTNRNVLREALAALEHDQWVAWSRSLVESEGRGLSMERLERWSRLWVPYEQLSEAEKDQDREWADKVLALVEADR